MNSKNCNTFDLHRLLLNLTDKINLKRGDKYVALPNLGIYYTLKNITESYSKYHLRHEMKNLNYLMDHIMYKTVKIIFNISKKIYTYIKEYT